MWNLFQCYLSGRHEFGVWCEPGTIFLRCVHCGRRSSGWSIEQKIHHASAGCANTHAHASSSTVLHVVSQSARVLPFTPTSAAS